MCQTFWVPREISRILKPDGLLVVMLYARHSLNYHLSIRLLRRAGLLGAYLTGKKFGGKLGRHLELARETGLREYLKIDNFTHRNTDGPDNPYALVYDLHDVRRDFPDFQVEHYYKNFRWAPPIPLSWLPGDPQAGTSGCYASARSTLRSGIIQRCGWPCAR